MIVPSNDAATSPHEGDPSVVELPTELFGCFSHQHESLSVRYDFGGVERFPYLKNNVLLSLCSDVTSACAFASVFS